MPYLQAFLFGMTVAIAIGPIAVLIMHLALNHGFVKGAVAGFAAACADFTYAVVAFGVGASLVARLQTHQALIEIVAAWVLLALAGYILWQVVQRHGRGVEKARVTGPVMVFVLTASNPLTLVLFTAFAGQVAPAADAWQVVGMALATGLGSFGVAAGLAAAAALLGKAISNPRIINSLNVLSAMGIGAFGLWSLLV